nr:serine hydrolase domain-containing protein [Streptomyces sp. DSM 41633]
ADRFFRIASMSKSFTAAAILQLRDRGALGLDDPVTDYLPWAAGLSGPTSDSPGITVRHCLTMSSGLPSDDPWADRQEEMTQADFDDLLRRPVWGAYSPGTAFAYSNLGYALLGRVVEAVSGGRFTDYLTSELLLPLGLAETTYDY